MQVEGQHGTSVLMATGARVSNAFTTYLLDWDSPEKLGVIPNKFFGSHGLKKKAEVSKDGCAFY